MRSILQITNRKSQTTLNWNPHHPFGQMVSDLNIGICLELVICGFAFGCGFTALGIPLDACVADEPPAVAEDDAPAFCSLPLPSRYRQKPTDLERFTIGEFGKLSPGETIQFSLLDADAARQNRSRIRYWHRRPRFLPSVRDPSSHEGSPHTATRLLMQQCR